jgi:phosphoribosylformylglycinamidine (FGAM) synthase PurS component
MARHDLTLTVGLKVTDNEARSALEALQEKMGLRDRVRDLAREELWELGIEAGSPQAASRIVNDLVRTTNLFANPNKHTYSLRPRGSSQVASESAAGAAGGDAVGSAAMRSGAVEGASDLAPDEIAILVSSREGTDGESVLSAIHRIGVDSVLSIRKWTRWRVTLAETPQRGDPEVDRLIRKIGVATGRGVGLLSNPHSQTSLAVLPWGEEKRLAA